MVTPCSNLFVLHVQIHCAIADIVSAVPRPSCLESDIASRQTSTRHNIADKSRQWHQTTANIDSAASSPTPAWNGSKFMPLTSLSWCRRQGAWLEDLVRTSPTSNLTRGLPLIRLGGSWSASLTDGPTQTRFYLQRRYRLEASASSP
jgi:hypothetical protein